MERKLVKQGRNALTMTLPSEWVKKNNLTGKNVVHILEERGNLIIKSDYNKVSREISINIENMTKGLAFHIITGKFIQGYDRIIIKHNNNSLAQSIGQGFMGMIVEEHTDNSIILRDMIQIPTDNFIQIFRRGCQLLISQARILQKQTKKESRYEDVKNEEKLLDSNLFYCLRYINKYENLEKSYKYFLLCTTIESVGDIISEISKYATKRNQQTIDLIVKVVEDYVLCLFTNDITKMYNSIQSFKKSIDKKSFVDGLAVTLGENLYNYIGYIVEDKN